MIAALVNNMDQLETQNLKDLEVLYTSLQSRFNEQFVTNQILNASRYQISAANLANVLPRLKRRIYFSVVFRHVHHLHSTRDRNLLLCGEHPGVVHHILKLQKHECGTCERHLRGRFGWRALQNPQVSQNLAPTRRRGATPTRVPVQDRL